MQIGAISAEKNNKQVIIFLAHGFNELFVVDFFCQQRRHGREVLFFGVQAGTMIGQHGLTLATHATVSDYAHTADYPPSAICIPGGNRCASAILSDPRVIKALKNRHIHAAPAAKTILQEMNISYHPI